LKQNTVTAPPLTADFLGEKKDFVGVSLGRKRENSINERPTSNAEHSTSNEETADKFFKK